MIKNKTIVIMLIFIVALIVMSVAYLFETKNMTITMEESELHPNNVIAIIMDLRNMRAAAQILRNDNLKELVTVEPDLKQLANYLENPTRFTKTTGEYLFMEANGEWWVGYNLAATDLYSEDRESVHKRLLNMAGTTIYGSMDINIPYDGEDVVYMPTR
jgi:hypothetical protein